MIPSFLMIEVRLQFDTVVDSNLSPSVFVCMIMAALMVDEAQTVSFGMNR